MKLKILKKKFINKKKLKKIKSFIFRVGKKILNHLVGYLILLAILIGIYYAYKTNIFDKTLKYKDAPKTGTYRELKIEGKTFTIREREKNTNKILSEKKYVGVRKGTFTQDEFGVIRGRIKRTGFIFEPAYTGFFTSNGTHVGLDIQWFYWNRWGLSSGVGIRETEMDTLAIGAYPAAVNYNLPFKWTPNTNVFIGYDFKTIIGGLSVKW